MWSRKPSTLDVSYLNLRLCIGVLGVALPFILRIGSAIFPPDPYSISAYYYSAMRIILVASLCILGTFLLTYQTLPLRLRQSHRSNRCCWTHGRRLASD
jgi:hypothetical protein